MSWVWTVRFCSGALIINIDVQAKSAVEAVKVAQRKHKSGGDVIAVVRGRELSQ